MSGRGTLGSDISYFFAVMFTLLFLGAGLLASQGKGLKHHRMILVSMVTMISYFIYYYEVRKLGVASLADQAHFPGPEWIYREIFRPVLLTHFAVVMLTMFSATYMIINGFKSAERVDGQMRLKNGRARISRVLWIISLVWLGLLSWWLFNTHHFGWGHKILFLSFGYFVPAGFAVATTKLLPELDRRHRALGRFCLVMFTCLLFTSTVVYYLLYIAEY